jgi:hypothetical protein
MRVKACILGALDIASSVWSWNGVPSDGACYDPRSCVIAPSPLDAEGLGDPRAHQRPVLEAHARELPDPVRAAALADPDTRILRMLGARGKTVAKTEGLAGLSAT